jgi:hypothetical protein
VKGSVRRSVSFATVKPLTPSLRAPVILAEGVGFEPTSPLRSFSSRAHVGYLRAEKAGSRLTADGLRYRNACASQARPVTSYTVTLMKRCLCFVGPRTSGSERGRASASLMDCQSASRTSRRG